jgi:single-stranded DNA-specific DHH superfamily exonuclease
MTKITVKQAKVFLNSISKKDRVAVIHHDDLDGFASGVLFYSFAKNKSARVKNFIGSYDLDVAKLMKKLGKFNKIILTDLTPNFVGRLAPALKKKCVFYTDHHPNGEGIPNNVMELRTVSQGYLPSSRTAFELTELDEWKGVAGVMGDMGHRYPENDKFLKNFFKREKITAKKFLEEVVFNMNKLITYHHKNPQKAFDFLIRLKTYRDLHKLKKKTEVVENEIQKHIKAFKKYKEDLGKIKTYLFDSKYPVKSTVSSVVAFKHPKSVVLIYVKKGKMVNISGRNQGGNINVRELLQKCVEGFENATAGGHDKASGAKIMKKDFKEFKKRVRDYAESLK